MKVIKIGSKQQKLKDWLKGSTFSFDYIDWSYYSCDKTTFKRGGWSDRK